MSINHKISIPSILEVGFGKIEELSSILLEHEFKNVLILFDKYIESVYGDQVISQMRDNGITVHVLSYNDSNVDVAELAKTAYELFNYDIIISMGGGAVIDYGKYMSYLKKLKFISIPTSASNDGFASSNSSLMASGKKTTIPAKSPYGIIVDLEIIKHAPDKFIIAGIGDLLSNITAIYDWEFEVASKIGEKDDFAIMQSKKAVNSFVRTPFETIKDNLFLKEMIESMVMGGIATEITGNSCPISGSEHLIAHALDKVCKEPMMHGIAVGIATYIISILQNHRVERIRTVLTKTGFFEYAKTLNLKRSEFETAIDMASSIKPNRYTYIHIDEKREYAKRLLKEDDILKEILK